MVQSAPGVGSTVTLCLPRRPGQDEPPRPLPSTTAPPVADAERPPAPVEAEDVRVLAGRTVLVVEDDARNLYAVASLLERYGATVVAASSAREAFAKLRESPGIALVLMDVMMPEMDGYQATREIRSMREFAALPIVALTAKAGDADRAECVAARLR